MRQRTIAIPDARDHGASLRVTRHPERQKVVLSHWRDRICVASTPVELHEVPALIGLLVDALAEGSDATKEKRTEPGVVGLREVVSVIRQWLRPRLAQVAELSSRSDARERRAS